MAGRAAIRHVRRSRDPRGLALAVLAAVLAVLGTLTAATSAAAGTPRATCAAQAAATGNAPSGRFLGVVHPLRTAASCASGPHAMLAGATSYGGTPPLAFGGGAVMATPSVGDQLVVTPIYWAPSGYSFTKSYKSVINTYLADLATDSDRTSNVFSTIFQYPGSNGAPNYRVTRAKPISDSHGFPSAGCRVDTGAIYADHSTYATCLDDAQIASEINSVVTAHGLTRGLGHIYLLFLPKRVESCYYAGSPSTQQCTLNYNPATSAYCAYHSGFGSSLANETVYADMPFPIYGSPTGYSCTDEGLGGDFRIQQPNGDADADVEVSPLSHEMAEAMTDPNGDAWVDSTGYENGDECAYIYGSLSGSDGAFYNQTVNGHHYLTQEEFSNSDYALNTAQGCQQREPAVTPVVTGLSPSGGSYVGGTSVVITGTGFPGTTAVRFGSTSATFTVLDATHVSAVAPTASPGSVHVTVSTSAGTSAAGIADQFTYSSVAPQPTVTAVSPSSGPAKGGTKVTITGTGLTGATAVSFGGKAATAFAVTDFGHIQATVPADSAGTVDVTVTTAGGTSATGTADRFTYLARPKVKGLSPRSGTRRGGTTVVITGTGFRPGSVVRFGTKAATHVTVKSSTRIVVHSPAHAKGTVDVVVSDGGGTSAKVRADRYRFT